MGRAPAPLAALTGMLLACSLFALPVNAQQAPATGGSPPAGTRPQSPYHAAGVPPHARDYYQIHWGVDSLSVKAVDSGLMIRFDYRVVDAGKAKDLNDKKASPYLVDERAKVKLVVPSMDKIGQLRQSSPPEVGKVYWMVFANKEKFVKPGDRVSVVIGKFRADGLIVQ
jgi:hypothetical protein